MKSLIGAFTVILLFAGCYNIKPVETKLLINAEIIKADSWVNLMPGSSETFHVTGIIRVTNNENFDIDTLNTMVNILQQDTVIYSARPELDPKVVPGKPLKKGLEKEFTFVLNEGLPIKKELNFDKPVKVEFVFKVKEKERSFRTENINIEKAY